MNSILFIILFLEVIFISYLDRRIWGTYFTPFCFLSIPYTIILFFILLLSPSFGFFEIYWKSIFVWNIGIIIFWIPSLFFGIFVFKRTGVIKSPFDDISFYIANIHIIKIIAIISLGLIYYKIILLLHLYSIGGIEFEKAISHGLEAHLSILLRFILIYFIVIVTKKDKVLWLLILLIILSVIISGSKSWILIPIISGLFIRNIVGRNRKRISLKLVLYISIFIFLVFFIAYYFSIGKNVKFSKYFLFLLNHIIFYFSAGIVAFSEYLKNNGNTSIDPLLIIGTPINVYNKFMGYETKKMISDIWTIVNEQGNNSNVKTALGTLYIYSGWFFGFLYLIFFSFIHYCILYFTIIKKNILLLIIYSFWSSILFFGWFELYYHLVAFYEIPIWCIIIYFITNLRASFNNNNLIDSTL